MGVDHISTRYERREAGGFPRRLKGMTWKWQILLLTYCSLRGCKHYKGYPRGNSHVIWKKVATMSTTKIRNDLRKRKRQRNDVPRDDLRERKLTIYE